MDDQSEPVQVFVRIRPEFDEIGEKPSPLKGITGTPGSFRIAGSNLDENSCISSVNERSIRLSQPDDIYGKPVSSVSDKIYHFDKIFPESSSQEEIYDSVADVVLATVKGYNSTIFAYGVTGSGKSYTMTGNKQAPGIIPRAIADIFKHIEKAASENDIFFYVRLSYVELYNNNFRNLLENIPKEQLFMNRTTNSSISMNGFFSELDDHDDGGNGPSTFGSGHSSFSASSNNHTFTRNHSTSGSKETYHPGLLMRTDKIEVRESKSAGTFLHGSNLRFPVTSAVESFQLISKGNKLRAVASTNCNEESSRSHAILTFHVESKFNGTPTGPENLSKPEIRLGKIHLVDLAGSERLAISGAEGDTLTETKNINSSLTALGDVLQALSRNANLIAQRQKQTKEGNKLLSSSTSSLDLLHSKLADHHNHPPSLSQVPYRNSKLTYLLKDSLGGNSKTIMITNIRKTKEYYHQTLISMQYSSRAKKVRNKTVINRNIIGDSAIHVVSNELERFKKVLEEKTNEFERLKLHVMNSESEKSALKNHLKSCWSN
jgi:kinesin family protein 11